MYNWWMLVVMLGGVLWTSAEETQNDEDSPVIYPADITSDNEKRNNHNIIRFGKRPSYDFIPEKRDGDRRQHSRLYFGKRPDPNIDTLLQYLQRNHEKDSWKRGHNIMRFGKRAENQMLRFGKSVDLESLLDPMVDEDKRNHQMMYFGKKDDGPKRASHSLLHFGKRFSNEDLDGEDLYELERRAPHQMIHFGKRDQEDDKRGGHAMIHFGKRGDEDLDESPFDKRAHSMIHFGKRSIPEEFFNGKRGPHSMIHFGKRADEEDFDVELDRNPVEAIAKKYHSVLHFGKRDDDPKRAHSMIHFGKKDSFKGSHSMVHFGKRSTEVQEVGHSRTPPEFNPVNKSEDQKSLLRQRRQVEFPVEGLDNPISDYQINERIGAIPFDNLEDVAPYYLTDEQNFYEQPYSNILAKKANSQNSFLHFGKR